MSLMQTFDYVNIPTFGVIAGTSSACLLLILCPKSSYNSIELIGGAGLLLSLGINLYRSEEVETFLHGYTTSFLTTMVVSVPFLLKQ